MHLTLSIKGILESSPLPVQLVVAWSVLWWRGSRRIRLWFAGLAPLGAVVGVVLGLLAYLGERGPVRPVSCTPALCGGWGESPPQEARIQHDQQEPHGPSAAFALALVLSSERPLRLEGPPHGYLPPMTTDFGAQNAAKAAEVAAKLKPGTYEAVQALALLSIAQSLAKIAENLPPTELSRG